MYCITASYVHSSDTTWLLVDHFPLWSAAAATALPRNPRDQLTLSVVIHAVCSAS